MRFFGVCLLVAPLLLLPRVIWLAEARFTKSSTPQAWTVDDVSEWARNLGFEDTIRHLREHGVDGKMLLDLNEADLEKYFSMMSRLDRRKFLVRVAELRGSGLGNLPGRNFWQYRELDRKSCDVATLLLTGAPRLALLLWIREDDLGHELAASKIKWVFPHIEIVLNHRQVMSGLPGGLLFGHLVMGVLEPVVILYAVFLYMSGKRIQTKVAKKVLIYKPLTDFGWAVLYYVIYPVMPSFLCDAALYLVMFRCWSYGFESLRLVYNADIRGGEKR